MKYLIILALLLVNFSCSNTNKTVREGQSEDTMVKVTPVDGRIGCNDTLGVSLRSEYSVYPAGTKRTRFVLCNNGGWGIRCGEYYSISYEDEKGVWRVLPINKAFIDMEYIVRPGESRFVNGSLYSDMRSNRSGRYRFFYSININRSTIILMAEFRLTDNKQELARAARNVSFITPMDIAKRQGGLQITEKQDSIFNIVKEMPEFPGGMEGLSKFVEDKMQYPLQARENGVQGRVIVQVVMEKDGSITNCCVVRGVDPYLDKEAIRIVKMMPKWKPGKQNGKIVRMEFTFPVKFRLSSPMG